MSLTVVCTQKYVSYFSTKTYVVGTQKTVLFSTQNMLKLIGKKYLQFYAQKFCLSKPVYSWKKNYRRGHKLCFHFQLKNRHDRKLLIWANLFFPGIKLKLLRRKCLSTQPTLGRTVRDIVFVRFPDKCPVPHMFPYPNIWRGSGNRKWTMFKKILSIKFITSDIKKINGPHREKTCLWGVRQSQFQTSLLSYRD